MKDISFIINHLGEEREKYFNAITQPVFKKGNYAFGNDLDQAFKKIM
jgi:hypothetical protein